MNSQRASFEDINRIHHSDGYLIIKTDTAMQTFLFIPPIAVLKTALVLIKLNSSHCAFREHHFVCIKGPDLRPLDDLEL